MPETYEEFAAYVEAANNSFGAKGIYFGADGLDSLFGFGFDCGDEFIVVDGTVHHSYTLDSFRSYLETAADWYSRGLIYSDFYLYGTDDTEDQMFCRGELAADIGRCASYDMFYGYMDEGYEATLTPMKPVRQNVGDEIHFSTTAGSLIKKEDTWSITESCADPELVMALVNYLFSEEGQLLFNWGVEGEAYTLDAEGAPEYTDMMINDPDNPYLFTAFMYASNTASEYAPSIMDVSKQYYSFDDIAWLAYEYYLDDGADGSYNYPDGATLSANELTEYASISSDVDTYVDTQLLAFITGQVALNDDSWEDFQSALTRFGVDTMVEMKQAAYDRYEEKLAGLNA
jgi:putative aldouronate transport system substrate-binding protein